MTAALSWPLQQAVFVLLSADPALAALLGADRIFDEPPHRDAEAHSPAPYLILGEESVEPWFDKTARGAVHELSLTITDPRRGYARVKQIAAAVCDALDAAEPTLARGRLVRLQFLGATFARADQGARRRATLRYRAVVEDV